MSSSLAILFAGGAESEAEAIARDRDSPKGELRVLPLRRPLIIETCPRRVRFTADLAEPSLLYPVMGEPPRERLRREGSISEMICAEAPVSETPLELPPTSSIIIELSDLLEALPRCAGEELIHNLINIAKCSPLFLELLHRAGDAAVKELSREVTGEVILAPNKADRLERCALKTGLLLLIFEALIVAPGTLTYRL